MYRIKLNEFEGPLDLLLFFIQRDELDIHNIPVSHITSEFLEYINYMQELDLEVASDFILMAATLIQIKAKMMMFREDEVVEEEEDPRYELVKRLLEYKRFKEVSGEISRIEEEQRMMFYRHDFEGDERIHDAEEEQFDLQNLTLFNLIKAYKIAIDNTPKEIIHNIVRFNVSLEEQLDYLNRKCNENEYVAFKDILNEISEKLRIVVTFIAILEMIKNGYLGIRIKDSLNDFEIFKLSGAPENLVISGF